MKKFMIFDIDGTLNQTDLYAVEAYQKAMRKRGRNIARSEVIACIGLSPSMIIERLFGSLTEEEVKEWRKDIKNFEFDLMRDHASSFEGMKETLFQLKEKGIGLAICSNAFPDHIEHVLDAIGLNNYFDEIGSLKMGNSKSEVLADLLRKLYPVKAIMVGDRKFDIQAAADNQIPMIGCAYGYAPDEIKEATVVIQNPIEILDVVDKLFEKE
ncbi:MAG: HAD family hydrolase [Hespellia sp.]|nr:HAD family hydrolase [Hespellia sp.]